jgi:hypothetical protein
MPTIRVRAKNLELSCVFDTERTERTIAPKAAILRLIYIRVTASRTDFRSGLQPPRQIPLRFYNHDLEQGISSSRVVDGEWKLRREIFLI